MYIGTTPGSSNLVNSGELQRTSFLIGDVPGNLPVFLRLFTLWDGKWRYVDVSFRTFGASEVTSVAGGAESTDTSAPRFEWNSVFGAEAYRLLVGTSDGASDVFDTGVAQRDIERFFLRFPETLITT